MNWFGHNSGNRVPTVAADPDDPRLKPPPAKPRKRGVAPETYAQETTDYRAAWRAWTAEVAAYQRQRAMRLGVTSYVWRSALPGICSVAARNNGRTFSFDDPPPDGHPGEGACDLDWCKGCIMRSIIRGVERR
ncbi:MAG TPA: hypothetical protein VG248_03530 [Caulobacteraceae bacterium]|nr:hypothetical protein [Caulobacteraceae bacterium]